VNLIFPCSRVKRRFDGDYKGKNDTGQFLEVFTYPFMQPSLFRHGPAGPDHPEATQVAEKDFLSIGWSRFWILRSGRRVTMTAMRVFLWK
jgi:hypothetical protein